VLAAQHGGSCFSSLQQKQKKVDIILSEATWIYILEVLFRVATGNVTLLISDRAFSSIPYKNL